MAVRALSAVVLLITLLQALLVQCLVSGLRIGAHRHHISTAQFASTGIESGSDRIDRARLRLAEIQGLIPIGASESAERTGATLMDLMTQAPSSSKVREISWRVAEPEIQYDAMRAQDELYTQTFRWLARNVELFMPLSFFILNVVSDIVVGKEKARRQKRADELLDVISKQSPAIIKAGQALASRPDLFPKEYLDSLQKLQDRCPAYPTQQALDQFEAEIGLPFDEVFEFSMPLEPVAAASIGQVYKGRLKSNGAEVAIKIQRPDCMASISTDLFVLRWYSGLAERLLKAVGRDISLVSVIDDFGELIYREMDYRAEAINAQRFAELYASIPDVFVPKVYPDLSTAKVLTMEWVEGARLSDKVAISRMGLDSSKFVDILVQCSLRQMLENGFFHADPHGGNLLAMPSGKLCFLDFGMVSYVESSQRYSIIEAVVHLVNRDFASLAGLYKRMGFIPGDVDEEPLILALEKALPDVLNASVGELNIKAIINKLGDVMFRFPFSLPPYYISIIRCLGVLEGVALQADENFRVIEDAYPYIASRLLTDSAEELQAALQKLLFEKDGMEPRWDRLEELLERAGDVSDYSTEEAANRLIAYLASDNEAGARLRSVIKTQAVENSDVLFERGAELLSTQLRGGGSALFGTAASLATKSQEGGSLAVIEELLSLMSTSSPESMTRLDEDERLANATKIVRLLARAEVLDTQRAITLARKVLKEPLVAEMVSEIVSSVLERNSGKFIDIVVSGGRF